MAELYAGFLPLCQSEEMKILRNNNSIPQMGFEHTTVAFQSYPCAPGPRRPQIKTKKNKAMGEVRPPTQFKAVSTPLLKVS